MAEFDLIQGQGVMRPKGRDEFEIAIVCALPLEFDAVCLTVDEFWDTNGDTYGRAPGDQNLYTTGRIGQHNVILALLPGMGKVSGAGTAASLRHSYSKLKLVVVAGVCGGVPDPGGDRQILLGDVAISKQIIQFDLGRQYPGQFVTKGGAQDSLRRPNREIRTLLASIQTEHGLERLEQGATRFLPLLQSAAEAKGRRATYRYPGAKSDRLFPSDYVHKHRAGLGCECDGNAYPCSLAVGASCRELDCDVSKALVRERLGNRNSLKAFVGNIGSGDTVMKSGADRDRIARTHELIAFEMEGAGIWDEVPCIVVKGVCDYADSHKEKRWQPFAAATAAAVTKALLTHFVHTENGLHAPAMTTTRPPPPSHASHDLKSATVDGTQQQKRSHVVYRLRNLPADIDKLAAARMILVAVSDHSLTTDDVDIHSLATMAGWSLKWQNKVAILSFKTPPSIVVKSALPYDRSVREWSLRVVGLSEPLVLDTHFDGLTVLNDVHKSEHQMDCIAISGLAGSPLVSWQPVGSDESFMWVRDALPANLPGVRFILYGYDAASSERRSVQTIVDLARTLMLSLEANGWSTPTTKPLLFLAHSLGGVLLKQMFVLLAAGNERAKFILGIIKGALFFGTPSRGMPIPHLLAMVGKQPNRDLIEHLSDQSEFLESLETQFSGVSYLERAKIYWVYETKASTIVRDLTIGKLSRAGSFAIMVDKSSATGDRWKTDSDSVIHVDENHLDMIRFGPGDHRIPIFVEKIKEMYCPIAEAPVKADAVEIFDLEDDTDLNDPMSAPTSLPGDNVAPMPLTQSPSKWQYEFVVQAIQPPDKNLRFDQVETNFTHTFNWAYDDSSVGLVKWLRSGTGIFWISGKPGSGKSTLMKYLLSDSRTTEILHSWRSCRRQIVASFFFHHRGTHMQKSFEGLLRGLLGQLLEKESELFQLLNPILDARLETRLNVGRYGTLAGDIGKFLRNHGGKAHRNQYLHQNLHSLLSVDPAEELNSVVEEHCGATDAAEKAKLKRMLLLDFSKIFSSPGARETLKQEAERLSRAFKMIEPECMERVVASWFYRADLSGIIREILQEEGLLQRHLMAPGENAPIEVLEHWQEAERRRFMQNNLIHNLASRQMARLQARLDIQLKDWTRPELEEGLRRIFDQDLIDLHVCLFFDALDEYDGRPEIIAEFLKDLVKSPASSKTHARVLFSSRPWPVFQEEFVNCPGFRIHEHTREDIREYCTGILQSDQISRPLLLPMAEEIANRARGVFLWVKLVLRDLSVVVFEARKANQDIGQRLQRCLDAIPSELQDYYTNIIQRLPSSSTREAYILLECLSRSSRKFKIEEIPTLVAAGESAGLLGRHQAQHATRKELDLYLRRISGGLVNAVADEQHQIRLTDTTDDQYADNLVQLLHQTCKEWVGSPAFKHIILGARATTTVENGHSFMAKFYAHEIVHANSDGRMMLALFDHVIEAERTTGVSQYEFLTNLPEVFYGRIMSDMLPAAITSALGFAVYNGLWLFLIDCVRANGATISESEDPLFTLLLGRLNLTDSQNQKAVRTSPAEVAELGDFLLCQGFRLERDLIGISTLFMRLWDSPDRETVAIFSTLILSSLRNSLSVDVRFPGAFGFFKTSVQWRLIHLSPPELARQLISQYDADVNCVNSAGQTPLDYLVDSQSVHQICTFGPDWLFDMANLLITNGGRFSSAPKKEILEFFVMLMERQFDVEGLVERVDPLLSRRLKERKKVQLANKEHELRTAYFQQDHKGEKLELNLPIPLRDSGNASQPHRRIMQGPDRRIVQETAVASSLQTVTMDDTVQKGTIGGARRRDKWKRWFGMQV